MSNFTSIIETSKLAIEALKFKLKTVAVEADAERVRISEQLDLLIKNFEGFVVGRLIPDEIKKSFNVHLSETLIRFTWNRLADPTRTSSIDVYYNSDKHFGNKDGNHSWDVSSPSNRLRVNLDRSHDSLEFADNMLCATLAINIHAFISANKEALIELHKAYADNMQRTGEIHYTIDKLERDIRNAESSIVNDRIVRIFKPAGSTSKCRTNTLIAFPDYTYYYSSRRNCIGFDGINILKETAKGIRVEFLTNKVDTEGKVIGTWTNPKQKWVPFDALVSMYADSEQSLARKKEKQAKLNATVNA